MEGVETPLLETERLRLRPMTEMDLGFTLEGRMRERHWYKGGPHDELFYALPRRDWGP